MVEVRGEGGAPTSAHNQSAVSAAPPPRLAGRRTCTPRPDTHTDTVPIPLSFALVPIPLLIPKMFEYTDSE
ncbi:hypothetical protein Pmani_003467 [Petrolisthes manimaculis]|uniref:Uncharacterized protein n=1 Tax=Petrolisthes manimaculis TaxID=1843537 RepID=A0AAE1UMG7_9EUCA|nr:hypothetical protein Pmani_003467 [Petrolisthes manimaculis]